MKAAKWNKIGLIMAMVASLGIGYGNNIEIHGLFITVPYVSSLLMLLALILGNILEKNIVINIKLLIVQFLFAISGIISVLLNVNNFDVIGSIVAIISLFIPTLTCLNAISLAYKINGDAFLSKFMIIYSVWVSAQILLVALESFRSFGILHKDNILISFGASNFIAGHLVVCFIYLFFCNKKHIKKWRLPVLLLNALAIIITVSFGAIIAILITLLISMIIRWKTIPIMRKLILTLLIGVIVVGTIKFADGTLLTEVDSDNMFYGIIVKQVEKLEVLSQGNYSSFFAGRDIVYKDSFSVIEAHPIFGYGRTQVVVDDEVGRTHNWVLEALVSYGTVGFIFYLLAIIIVLYCVIQNRKLGATDKAKWLALSVGLIHGLVEPTFFSRTFDFLWWTIAGVAIGELMKRRMVLNNLNTKLAVHQRDLDTLS